VALLGAAYQAAREFGKSFGVVVFSRQFLGV
jgi:hypothetical protein